MPVDGFDVEGNQVIVRRAESAILARFGSVTPRRRPEDFSAVRREVERTIAEEVVDETATKRQHPSLPAPD